MNRNRPGGAAAARRGTAERRVILATADRALCLSVATELQGLRWTVYAAAGAADIFALLADHSASTVLIDSWLPDLEVRECVAELAAMFPALDVLALDGTDIGAAPVRGVYRGELLHAVREAHRQQEAGPQRGGEREEVDERHGPNHGSGEAWRKDAGGDAVYNSGRAWDEHPLQASSERWNSGALAQTAENADAAIASRRSDLPQQGAPGAAVAGRETSASPRGEGASGARGSVPPQGEVEPAALLVPRAAELAARLHTAAAEASPLVPELLGSDPRVREVSRRIGLVAHRRTAVLVHGPTGSGKELVARAIHRLSGRPQERFVAINCAAIPDALIEAELFGHARGAFTGAVQGRAGRIEAAAGGTLFLDEIGELPLAAQGKLLRFLESGELQRVGENHTTQVDARVVAATHRKLGAMAKEGTFRLDLLHRLSVFLIQTPGLGGRSADLDALIAHTLDKLGREEAPKQLSAAAREKLHAHGWPGNVRELEHTLERCWILAGAARLIEADCVDFGEALL